MGFNSGFKGLKRLCRIIRTKRCLSSGTLSATLTKAFRDFSSVVKQMPGYNLQRRATAHTLPNQFDHPGFESQKAFKTKLLIVLFYVLFVCKCVLYYCYLVSNQLQLTNISTTSNNFFFVQQLCWARNIGNFRSSSKQLQQPHEFNSFSL